MRYTWNMISQPSLEREKPSERKAFEHAIVRTSPGCDSYSPRLLLAHFSETTHARPSSDRGAFLLNKHKQ